MRRDFMFFFVWQPRIIYTIISYIFMYYGFFFFGGGSFNFNGRNGWSSINITYTHNLITYNSGEGGSGKSFLFTHSNQHLIALSTHTSNKAIKIQQNVLHASTVIELFENVKTSTHNNASHLADAFLLGFLTMKYEYLDS